MKDLAPFRYILLGIPAQKVFKTFQNTLLGAPKCHFDKDPKDPKDDQKDENDTSLHSKHTRTLRNTGLLWASL